MRNLSLILLSLVQVVFAIQSLEYAFLGQFLPLIVWTALGAGSLTLWRTGRRVTLQRVWGGLLLIWGVFRLIIFVLVRWPGLDSAHLHSVSGGWALVWTVVCCVTGGLLVWRPSR